MKLSYLFPLFSFLALCASCSTQKQVQKDISASVDSVARTSQHRTKAQLDSMFSHLEMTFDTLEVVWQRPTKLPQSRLDTLVDTQTALAPEVVKLHIVKGQVANTRTHQRQVAEAQERHDTLAYKMSTADKSMEHTATTRIYEPPSGTIIVLVSLLLVATFVFIRFRK